MKYLIPALFLFALILQGCRQEKEEGNKIEPEGIEMVKKEIANFSPTELKYDDSMLDERQKIVVEKLYRASKIIDDIFLNQVYSKNEEIKAKLMSENTGDAKLRLKLFNIMFGPFDRLEHDRPFI